MSARHVIVAHGPDGTLVVFGPMAESTADRFAARLIEAEAFAQVQATVLDGVADLRETLAEVRP